MQRITQARAKNKTAGDPIYLPFKNFTEADVHIRKGQLTLIAAGPASGKSAIAQAIAQRGDDKGNLERTFYFSADSTAWDLYTRAAAIATNRTIGDIEDELNTVGPGRLNEVINAATSHMMTDFQSSPNDDYVIGQIEAYADLYGRYPDIIVMDNLKNLELGNGEDEFRALEDATVFLHDLAKDTGAAVIALHHVVGAMEDGFSQIPLSGLRGKVGKTPAMVITLWKRLVGGKTMLNASVVKNRSGKTSAAGDFYLPLHIDLERMSFRG